MSKLFFVAIILSPVLVFSQITWTEKLVQDTFPSGKLKFTYFPKQISFIKNDVKKWTIDLPGFIQSKPIDYFHQPIDFNAFMQKRRPQLSVAITRNKIFIPISNNLLVYSKKDGNLLEKISPNGTPFWFDEGHCLITIKKKQQISELRGPNLLTEMDCYLFFCNGMRVYIFSRASGQLLKKVTINAEQNGAKVTAKAKWKSIILEWEGIVYL